MSQDGLALRKVRCLAIGLGGLVVAVGSMPAAANTSGTMVVTAFAPITVIGDGHHYTDVDAIGYLWQGRVVLDSPGAGRIKHWRIWPILTLQGQSPLELRAAALAASYPSASDPWPRPNHAREDVARYFSDIAVSGYVVTACNRLADQLRKQGRSDAEIFSKSHVLPATVSAGSSVDATVGSVSIESQAPLAVTVQCAKWSGALPPKAGDFTSGMDVKQAKLVVFPHEHAGGCPVKLTLFGNVSATTFGSFQSWVESTEGWTSIKQTRTIDSKRNGEALEEFVETLVVPVSAPKGPPTGGPAGGGAVGGLAAPKPPIDPMPGPARPPVAPGGITTGQPANVHQASLRVVARAKDKTIASPWRPYRVTCDPKVAPGGVPHDPLGVAG